MTITARILADSVSPTQKRIITLELVYPRFIHAEFMTHRVFSRNAASSRAIPIEKVIRAVEENPAMPIHWGKNQPGMQAREELEGDAKGGVQWLWGAAALWAAEVAKSMANHGAHKQIVNRILEPFQHITVIVTATEWDNFFNLRLHPDAQPEMQELARQMKRAMDESEPRRLRYGEWHLPLVKPEEYETWPLEDLIQFSVARCARVSYLNHDGSQPDPEKDRKLAERLLKDGHMSPFEHQATPAPENSRSGNFVGWTQYRQTL